jgi:hypothetical protein
MRDFRGGWIQSTYVQEVFGKLDRHLRNTLKSDWLMHGDWLFTWATFSTSLSLFFQQSAMLASTRNLYTTCKATCLINYSSDKSCQDSSVIIVTRLRSGCWRKFGSCPSRENIFSRLCRPGMGPTQPSVQWVQTFLLRGKVAGAWCWPLTSI